NRADLARRADRVIVLADGRATIRSGGTEPVGVPSAAAKLDFDPVGRDPVDTDADTDADADASAEPAGAERRAFGAVPWAVYAFYLRALLSPAVGALVAILFIAREVFSVGSDYWLSSWSDGQLSTHDFLIGFAALAVGTVIVTYARDAIGAVHAVAAGRTLHDAQIERLLGAPLALHEVTPSGRTLNRLSRDQRIIDQQLGPIVWESAASVMLVLSTMTVIVLASPVALVPIALLALRYYQLQRFFRASARDLRRLDAVARAPLMSHFADVLGGVPSIRAYRAEDYFSSLAAERLELSQRTVYTQEAVRSWISVRLDLLGSTLAGIAAFVAVATRSSIDSRLAALSITYAMIITYTLGRMVRTTLDVESSMSAVERAKECAELPAEHWSGEVPPATWPATGAVELEGVVLRYQPGLPLALEGLSLALAPGEKVAVVGRTGSGKSSIVAALVRLRDVEMASIRIDGIDLAGVALKAIRERITVIPQDPFLFKGTVRENLDPERRFDDARLFEVLERAHVASVVSAMPEGLDTQLGDGSALLSVGQRQMICLARALLRPSRVLVLDEFTASVDDATEALLLDTVAREFAASTVLMIVHRLAAARACDRVIVMDRGRVAEQGAPRALLADSNSAFAGLVRAAG
ncbi:MAG: ABC transporter transmembrane domain-containing protein, partial [Kofleriaceae bacterium]